MFERERAHSFENLGADANLRAVGRARTSVRSYDYLTTVDSPFQGAAMTVDGRHSGQFLAGDPETLIEEITAQQKATGAGVLVVRNELGSVEVDEALRHCSPQRRPYQRREVVVERPVVGYSGFPSNEPRGEVALENSDLSSTRLGPQSTWDVAAPAVERVVRNYLRKCRQHQPELIDEIESEYREREAAGGFRVHSPKAAGTWLAMKRSLDHLKKPGHAVTDRLDNLPSEPAGFESDLDEALARRIDLQRAFARFSDAADARTVRVIHLLYREGRSIADVVTVTGISRATVYRLKASGLEILHRLLEDD